MGRPLGSRNKPAGNGDEVPLRVNTVSGAELRAYIERVEGINATIKDYTEDRKEIFKEIKDAGIDAATVRAIIKRRAMDPEKRVTMDELMDQYMSALGDFADTPLGVAGAERMREEHAG
jgi:uncharacterized protein (UPF0335 family)